MKDVKYNDQLEKILTAIFGSIGTLAIFINLHLKGYQSEYIFDAIKDIAGLVVVIAVFLVANKLFRKGEKFDFAILFEIHLKNWIEQNDYLVCENFAEEGKGKYSKRYCSMVIEHSNIVTRKKYAKDATQNKEKGAFVYLPYKDETGNMKHEFEFRFNERTFERQNIYKTDNGEVNLRAIIEQFANRIDDNFKSIGVSVKANPSNKTIAVSFEDMEQSEENAKKLIDLVEFVKTLTLALA
ncbi:MAG: hypothetical protein CVV22_06315 [Ignavibacteriae bacterium HGW-Ignavibacteriae-1]|jgi:hypothetical protein|nr:MAG: hypothetical protein CVV22_06315 [Ignavibacteriae bacterium HGW-Ignavibacteriae-1]